MSAARRIRRARGDHRREVPSDAAALTFTMRGGELVVCILAPRDVRGVPAQLAAMCAAYARTIVDRMGDADEPTTTGATRAGEGERDHEQAE